MFVVFLNDEGNQIEGGKTWLDANDKSVRIEESDGVWRAVDGYGEHPVTVVTWYGARAYCVWAERRLPTEAEWEKAARGTDVMIYPWGDESPTCNLANYSGCEGKTDIVGIRLDGSSPYGAFDMAGNVWEWVADWYDHDYYETSPSRNPQGPSLGEGRVLRSSAWTNHPWALRTTYRSGYTPNVTYVDIGFRCGLGASQ